MAKFISLIMQNTLENEQYTLNHNLLVDKQGWLHSQGSGKRSKAVRKGTS